MDIPHRYRYAHFKCIYAVGSLLAAGGCKDAVPFFVAWVAVLSRCCIPANSHNAGDHNALNAGVFLVRVDERSLALLNQILEFPRKQLRWAEQSALISLNETHRLEESGQLVVVPSHFFNSYEGRAAYPGEEGYKSDEAVFQLHFPSKRFKRLALLPLIRDLQSGAVVKSDALLAKEAALLKEKGQKFWRDWRKNRGV